jgi:hypothetical protein
MDEHGELEGLASWPARTESTRERCCAPVTATTVKQNDSLARKETHRKEAQRSQEAYFSWQMNKAIPGELEGGVSGTTETERGVSPHVEACQRSHLTNGCGQRRQAVGVELSRGVSNDNERNKGRERDSR